MLSWKAFPMFLDPSFSHFPQWTFQNFSILFKHVPLLLQNVQSFLQCRENRAPSNSWHHFTNISMIMPFSFPPITMEAVTIKAAASSACDLHFFLTRFSRNLTMEFILPSVSSVSFSLSFHSLSLVFHSHKNFTL